MTRWGGVGKGTKGTGLFSENKLSFLFSPLPSRHLSSASLLSLLPAQVRYLSALLPMASSVVIEDDERRRGIRKIPGSKMSFKPSTDSPPHVSSRPPACLSPSTLKNFPSSPQFGAPASGEGKEVERGRGQRKNVKEGRLCCAAPLFSRLLRPSYQGAPR